MTKYRKPIIAGNWKMNKLISEALYLARELAQKIGNATDREVVLCPPFTALAVIREAIDGSFIKLGGQNMHWELSGAYTGEVSPAMLKDAGCSYVILGHSERRKYFGETDEMVNKKIHSALSAGLVPIVCVGESIGDREKGETLRVVENQIRKALSGVKAEKAKQIVIAYEPVWAIGTGKTATPEQAEEVQSFIRGLLGEIVGEGTSEEIRILYGGSITPENISGLMRCKNVDGGLVGGASLQLESFLRIVNYDRTV